MLPAGFEDRGHTLYRLWMRGELGYVGQTRTPLRTRLQNHSTQSVWWPAITSVTAEHRDGMDDLLEAEEVAIFTERPLFNRTGPARIGRVT